MATDAARVRRTPGEAGTWVFIFGDMTVFAVLFATYLYYRAEDPALFASSQQELNQTFGAVNTLLLLLSSLLVVAAVRAVRDHRGVAAPRLIAGAMACGLAFSGLKVVEYGEKISHDQTPATDDFFLYYFVLTGMHWFHLLIGLAVLTALIVITRKPNLTARQVSFVEGGACFWHMVDLLWIVLFPLLYFVR
ncbi:cytochrome c oxidase subunit 3 [Paraconexibacter sp.]|uniref:cytochrome c oxidase subunit 3 n=1 Tax=Paraconexibacter sp. TaxID=2949640 RepID=UPI00356345A1